MTNDCWTAAEVAALIDLAGRGYLRGEIVKGLAELGFARTRGAVIGKLDRLGLSPIAVARKLKVKRRRKLVVEAEPPPPPPPVVRDPDAPVPFIERASNQCWFPLWSHNERTGDVCGMRVKPTARMGLCPEHATVCLNAP